MDLLDAAYDLLRTANRPLTAKEMVDSILKNGLWKTNGKTPDATLGARIYVDIKKHGALSRFAKVGKGLFALSGVKPAERVKMCVPVATSTNGNKTPQTRKQIFSFTDCAEKVLRGQGKHTPMHYLEITTSALKNGWPGRPQRRPCMRK